MLGELPAAQAALLFRCWAQTEGGNRASTLGALEAWAAFAAARKGGLGHG